MKTQEIKTPEYHWRDSVRHIDGAEYNVDEAKLKETFQEFARQAVRVALEDAAENSKVQSIFGENGGYEDTEKASVDKSSILSRESEILKKLGIEK